MVGIAGCFTEGAFIKLVIPATFVFLFVLLAYAVFGRNEKSSLLQLDEAPERTRLSPRMRNGTCLLYKQ